MKYNGYNDWKKKKQKKPQLSGRELKLHASLIQTFLEKGFTAHWTGAFLKDFEMLGTSIHSYAEYLEEANKKQVELNNAPHPAKQVKKDMTIRYCKSNDIMDERYQILSDIMENRELYDPLIFDEEIHVALSFKNRNERHAYFYKLSLNVPVDMLR